MYLMTCKKPLWINELWVINLKYLKSNIIFKIQTLINYINTIINVLIANVNILIILITRSKSKSLI